MIPWWLISMIRFESLNSTLLDFFTMIKFRENLILLGFHFVFYWDFISYFKGFYFAKFRHWLSWILAKMYPNKRFVTDNHKCWNELKCCVELWFGRLISVIFGRDQKTPFGLIPDVLIACVHNYSRRNSIIKFYSHLSKQSRRWK